jgi:hypothetical protein
MIVDDVTLHVSGRNGQPKRLVIAAAGDGSQLHRDVLDTNSQHSRKRFFQGVAEKTGIAAGELYRRLDASLVQQADDADDQVSADGAAEDYATGDGDNKPSQATALVRLAEAAELWHTPDSDAYATVPVSDHREVWPVRSKRFKRWLSRRFYITGEKAPSSQAMQDALGVIEGKAIFEGEIHDVHIRVAEHDGAIYIDLCNATWQVVEITVAGWRVIADSPVRFRRAKAMGKLPIPVKGGSVHDLRKLVNVRDEDWPLVVAWLLAAMRPVGPYPLLCLHGEQGSAKSSTARVLRSLIDPNSSPLRSEPREPRDLMIAANNGWVIALDNLSRVPAWLSDALCRISTGGGFSTRTLYENDEETIFDATRPVILTGIEELATRGDLLDRAILVNLPSISESNRMPESQFWTMADREIPVILGAMLTTVSQAIGMAPTLQLANLPRMADFAIWASAGETAMGFAPGEFMAAYAGNRDAGNELAIESSMVGKVIVEMMGTTSTWTGTASELLAELDDLSPDKIRRLKAWPQTPRTLAGQVKRLAPNLRAAGIDVDLGRTSRRRFITLTRKYPDFCVTTVTSVTDPEKQGSGDDANDAPVTQTTFPMTHENPGNDANDDDDAKIQPHSGTAGIHGWGNDDW